jgi:superfamily II DNA or RNA helicase
VLRLSRSALPSLPDERDATIVQMLLGANRGAGGAVDDYLEMDHRYLVPDASAQRLLRMMIETGRCRLRAEPKSTTLQPLTWNESPASPERSWQFVLRIDRDPREAIYWLKGSFRRPAEGGATPDVSEMIDANAPAVVLRGGFMLRDGNVERFDDGGAFDLLQMARGDAEVFIPETQLGDLLNDLFAFPRLPKLELPDGMKLEEVRPQPRPKLIVRKPAGPESQLLAELLFDYGGTIVPANPPQPAEYDKQAQRLIWRDAGAEAAAKGLLANQGLRYVQRDGGADDRWRIQANKLNRVVSSLVAAGWVVEAEGRVYRRGGKFNVRVASGIDWFELQGGIDFDGQVASLPQLLAAVRSGEKLVQLGDGSFGVLPEEWLQQYGLIAAMGQVEGEQIKFNKKQIGVLDALLASIPEASWDDQFARLRDELAAFGGVQAIDAPDGFVGQLRPYQREGLGWIDFLRKFGFGGCLADDMGLGKTVQVLAMLRERKLAGIGRPTLVVVPRSLIFNWVSEAQKFTPDLRVLDHSGAQRSIPADKFKSFDVVLSTYGTVRRDAAELRDIPFDYVILDEAQAIKNSQSESAKAVRLLKGDHRLALSGTPVQNHLGELWSLFEFLNPGLLGTAAAFKAISNGGGNGGLDLAGRETLGRALRPFILRRTKQQVATDLPEKLEQTLICELDREQRKLYNELREHFRATLLGAVEKDGINKNKMLILEALLRLRQAACHPGLIDKARAGENSAKLDALIPQLEEVIDEDHKVLVFSQFTSFLSIVRKRLDERNIVYEYLDGKTTDRQKRVRRFQNDPDCKLFLISLKAGGLGLNLTSAEYVYLLDPWWNPAVEQQAIDRTHRIGQTRQVFAYRLIAKDTVEEKVLELQKAKRDLADAIITADNSLISKMGREELEMLLS